MKISPEHPAIVAVVLAFRCRPDDVMDNLRALGSSICGVIIIDNSGAVDPGKWAVPGAAGWQAQIIMNGGNAGVATALNQGVAAAAALRADFLLLLDEDSRPEPAMVGELLGAWRSKCAAGIPVAALGPDFSDSSSQGGAIFVRCGSLTLEKSRCGCGESIIQSDYLMTSGSLIPMAAFAAVGPFRDGLFVDYVDMEWCFRAQARGFACFGVCAARMQHRFGEGVLPLIRFGKRRIPLRDPGRFYYICRNALILFRLRHCPLSWKMYEALRLSVLLLLYLGFAPRRLEFLGMSARGIRDGLLGREGPLLRAQRPGEQVHGG